ncbi:hypothetical protein [Niallia sp. FSL W8-1348]|uniref:hypothetical protein n=1 Tax=Niallia sp. FSL W8-1348 TaxID=2954656 RepID=UPI0030F721CF
MNKKQATHLYALVYPIIRNKTTAKKIVIDMLQDNHKLGEKELARKAINRAIETVKR